MGDHGEQLKTDVTCTDACDPDEWSLSPVGVGCASSDRPNVERLPISMV